MRLLLLCAIFVGVAKAGELIYEMSQPATEDFSLCPDQNSKCPKESTCCQLTSGQWGCCPFAQRKALTESAAATVGVDGEPAGEKTEALFMGGARLEQASPGGTVDRIFCNRTRYCLDFQTCCWQPIGGWGCCRYRHATCCARSSYCCPAGWRCSYPPGRCLL